MDLMSWGIILTGFFISTLSAVLYDKKTGDKWKSVLLSLVINTVLLGSLSTLLYKTGGRTYLKEEELGLLSLLVFIPVITLLNFYTLEIIRDKAKKE